MKKLLIFALGLGIVLGTVSFAQDGDKGTEKSTQKKGKKKKGTTSDDKKD